MVVNRNPCIGKHVWTVPQVQVEDMMRILFAFVVFYVFSTPLIKLSIILFYRRIFGMTYSIWFCMFLTAGYFVSGIIAFLVCCRPVSYYWTQFTNPDGGRCVYDLYNFYISYAGVNVITDVAILLVPIPIVWKLQMRRTQKLLVCGILLIGGLCVTSPLVNCIWLKLIYFSFFSVCIASLVRIYYITFIKDGDYTWVIGKVFTWSSIEPSIGILCACLPTLHPLIRAVMSRVFGTRSARYVASRNQEPTNKKTFIRRQRPLDWDETLLTTHDVQVEMDGTRRDSAQNGHITVETEFQMVEESNQLK